MQRIDTDPENGQYLPIMNYLNLSKRQRYRGFFFEANQICRQHVMRKVLDQLYMHALDRKQKLKQFFLNKERRYYQVFMNKLRSQTKCNKHLKKITRQ